MRDYHTPRIDISYWLAILLASVAGTNLGDVWAHGSGLGIGGGLAAIAGVVALAFIVERFDTNRHELWFWLVILLIRTGATNIADFVAWRLDSPLPLPVLLLALVLAMAGAAWFTRWRDAGRSIGAGPGFWLAMLAAGVLGTVLGDVLSRIAGQGRASLGLVVLLGLVLARRGGALWAYWLAVALARTAGTSLGDFLAESPIMGLGLPLATTISVSAFVLAALSGQSLRRKSTW